MGDNPKEFVAKQIKRISNGTQDPEFNKLYKKCQYLIAMGKYDEAMPELQNAFDQARQERENFIWEGVYYSIGGLLATTYDFLGKYFEAEKCFDEIMEFRPDGFYIGEYAVFLHRRKKEIEKAHETYEKALALFPDQSSIYLKYAGFLRHAKRDLKGAQENYRLACEANPQNAEAMGSYASFLHGVIGDTSEAEGFYAKAVEIDDSHTNNLCNYGLFLSEERKNYARAEELFQRALQVNPKHSNTLYNFAVMLDTHCKRKDDAEGLYRRCIAIEQKHAFALYNLAVLLEEKYANLAKSASADSEQPPPEKNPALQEVAQFYKKAVESDPNDAISTADYARFLLMKLGDYVNAEPFLHRALRLASSNENAIFHLAVLHQRHKADLLGTESILRNLLQVNPKHAAGTQQLARVMIEIAQAVKDGHNLTSNPVTISGRALPVSKLVNGNPSTTINTAIEEAMDLYEKCMTVSTDPSSAMAEYAKVASTLGTNRHKLRAVSALDAMLKNGGSKSFIDGLKAAMTKF